LHASLQRIQPLFSAAVNAALNAVARKPRLDEAVVVKARGGGGN
jgi:hypothetical protein